MPLKVLIVDDDATMREVLESRLSDLGYEVQLASCGLEAKNRVVIFDPDVVISDVVLPDISGLDLLGALRECQPDLVIILITAYGSVDTAVEAMKRGARDFLTKPLDYIELRAILKQINQDIELRCNTRQLESALTHGAGLGPLVGKAKSQLAVYDMIHTVAPNDASVIIAGQSGTGKELVARTIHDFSCRCDGPFVPINAAAIPEGLTEDQILGHEKGAFTGASTAQPGFFELAHRGTLFLDEITELPLNLQPKFLRVLEDSRVRRLGGKAEIAFDVRLISATSLVPETAVSEGRIRSDLFYRLNVFTISLPTLREREQDIPLISQHFTLLFNRKHGTHVEGLRPETLDLLQSHEWPGNVRELRNTIERAVILAQDHWIEPRHLSLHLQRRSPPADSPGIHLPYGVTSAEAEEILIRETLRQTGNNKAAAARRLGLNVKTIHNKLKSFGDKTSKE